MRWMWSQGDYPRVAEVLEPHAEALAEACEIAPGTTVLDVAAGNGNFALAAARRGAIVTATDLTPRMVELGRARSADAGVSIEWAEADAEHLPYIDASYDIVASVFGSMFAPQPQLVASEMFRVAKPGGLVAMANYSPGGYLGRLSDLMNGLVPRPAVEFPSPFEWGDEAVLRRRFERLAASIEVEHRTLYFESDSVEEFLEFWENTNAPQAALKARVTADVYQRAQREKEQLVRELNESGHGRLKVTSPYILAMARKATGSAADSPHPPGSLRERADLPTQWRGGDVAARQYDAMATEYAADDGTYNAYYERPATIALLGDVAGLDVLEVGCGAGPLTAYLVAHGAAVTATDVSAEMVRLARTQVGDRATFHVTSIEKPMSFARDHSYDLIVGSLVMHYVRDWEPVLREFRRVLRPGGAVVFSTHHPTMDWELSPGDYFATKQITETWKKGSGEFEVTFWRRPLTEMTRAIAAAGFVIEQLVEPQPLPELGERSPRDFANLSTRPQFLFFRLRPG